jgi:glucose/arabinose dehydrogenase
MTSTRAAAALAAAVTLFSLLSCGGGGGGTGASQLPDPAPTPTPALSLTLREVASGLNQPLLLTAPAGDSRQFIVERPGRIRLRANGLVLALPFLDLSGQISTSGEGGLLSLAFHPNYAQNGRFFLYYTDLAGNIAIDEGHVSANPDRADALSLSRLLAIPHPGFSNHYGGMLTFGPDGYLYLGTGDGGGAGDPNGNSQNLASLLGKLLRLNVNGAGGAGYTIPADNPYVAQAGKRGEIWASGLRNPWRFSFDGPSQQLYIADVGQDQREEVDIVPASTAGANFGWNIMEGTRCYSGSCVQTGLTLPRVDYEHGSGNVNGCSITGGFVYRGQALPELIGRYLYSDYCKGFLKSFLYSAGTVSEARDWGVGSIGNVPAFGQDAQGELYLLASSGKIYQVVRQTALN